MVKFSNYWKAGFGTGTGFATTLIVGMALFIPGFIIVTRENKKSKKNTALLVMGFILMFLGVALGFGLFGGDALNLLKNEL